MVSGNEDRDSESLIQILIDRHDTLFEGEPLEQLSEYEFRDYQSKEVVRDENGVYYTQPHDYVDTAIHYGEHVGIFVADMDNRHYFDHEEAKLPHGIGLFVREDYRGEGIATRLLNRFMESVSEDTLVVRCERSVVPFYYQLDFEVLYLQSGGVTPTAPLPPDSDVLSIDTSDSPEHGVPFNTASAHESLEKVPKGPSLPDMRIQQDGGCGQLCNIPIDLPYPDTGLDYYTFTDEAISQMNDVLGEYGWSLRDSAADTDFIHITRLEPDKARTIADKLYPIITDPQSIEQ